MKFAWVAFFLLALSAKASVIFTDSFEQAPDSNSSRPQWKNLSQRVTKTDPVFTGSSFSGVTGEYFALVTGLYIDLPTKEGSYYSLQFSYAATDTWKGPYGNSSSNLQVNLTTNIAAYRGTHVEESHGEPKTIEDLEPIAERQISTILPGDSNWKIYKWNQFSVGFVAKSAITRVSLTAPVEAAASYAAIDDVTLERTLSPAQQNLIKKYQRQLTRLNSNLKKLKLKSFPKKKKTKLATSLRKEIKKTKALLSKAQQDA